MSVAAARPTTARDVARKLRPAGMLRGVAALAVGAYAIAQSPCSPALVARASASYWIVDGLVTLWASSIATTLARNRMLLVFRATIAIAAGLTIFALPLDRVFGTWQPGQLLLLVSVASLVLTVIALQLVAGAFDVVMWLEIRRRLPGEWSVALAATLSVLLGVIIAATFVVPASLGGYALSAAAVTTGVGILIGAARLRSRALR